jgi:hypothetical protein
MAMKTLLSATSMHIVYRFGGLYYDLYNEIGTHLEKGDFSPEYLQEIVDSNSCIKVIVIKSNEINHMDDVYAVIKGFCADNDLMFSNTAG